MRSAESTRGGRAGSEWTHRAGIFASSLTRLAPALELDRSLQSVSRLEAFVRSQFDGKSPVLSPNFAADLGSYLGEVVIANIGGVWAADGSPSVTNIGAVEAIFPIDKARKRLERGPSESLEYYLTVIARHAKASDQGDQPT